MLNYITFGKGKNVIFLHGWGGSTVSFRGLAEALLSEYRVTLVDLYGFGDSLHPDYPIGLNDYVNGVVEIIRKEQMSEAVLVGHSFGGRVAVRLTRLYPQYCLKLILIDSAGLKPRFSFKRMLKIAAHKFMRKAVGKGLKGSDDYAALTGAMRSTFVNIIHDYTDGDLRYIGSGALILWGRRDKDTPLYMAKRFARGINHAKLVVFEDAGHYSYLEKFSETLFEIKAYIGSDG